MASIRIAALVFALGLVACSSSTVPDVTAGRKDLATYTQGCASDADCALVRADCCGCASGGVSTAALKTQSEDWEATVSARCPPSGAGADGCSTIYRCDGTRAICRAGKCVAEGTAAVETPCGPGEVLNDNRPCGPRPDGTMECGPQYGDLQCYARCASDADCHDSARPYCRVLGLFAGGDYNCNQKVRVCRAVDGDDCR